MLPDQFMVQPAMLNDYERTPHIAPCSTFDYNLDHPLHATSINTPEC